MRASANVNNFFYAPGAQRQIGINFQKYTKNSKRICKKVAFSPPRRKSALPLVSKPISIHNTNENTSVSQKLPETASVFSFAEFALQTFIHCCSSLHCGTAKKVTRLLRQSSLLFYGRTFYGTEIT
jgi:hypothetical protein